MLLPLLQRFGTGKNPKDIIVIGGKRLGLADKGLLKKATV